MRRLVTDPREGWQRTVASQGLVYAMSQHLAGRLYAYWDESAYDEFSLPEVEALEEVVAELHETSLAAAGRIVATEGYRSYAMTDSRVCRLIHDLLAASRRTAQRLPAVGPDYHGDGPAKLLEYNADTPTPLIEAASAQWFWMDELFPGADQWNSLHERLIEAWRPPGRAAPRRLLHFAHSTQDPEGEELVATAYLQECADQVGLATRLLTLEEIDWDRRAGRSVGQDDVPITAIFKLYWWAGRRQVRRAPAAAGSAGPLWIEPAWKMRLSNKELLATLRELRPGHPNLLPAHLHGPRELATSGYVRKALLGREGGGVTIVTPAARSAHRYRREPRSRARTAHCYQTLHALPEFHGNRPVLGAWVVDGEAAGADIRESTGLITDASARFLPNIII